MTQHEMQAKADTMKRKLDALRDTMLEMFPHQWVSVELYSGKLEVIFHQCGTYDQATEMLRQCGCDERTKRIYGEETTPWTDVSSQIGEHTIQARADGLPPSCHIETFTVKVPKTSTLDLGEFLEIERRRVVCG
jgi:hypothetical protein